MSIWDAFGKGRYKGFSREAGQLLDKAVELAGGLGCKKADTGHLLWAMLQSDGGPAARFLAGKNISELEVRRQLSAGRDGSVTRLARGDMAGGPRTPRAPGIKQTPAASTGWNSAAMKSNSALTARR